jgi:putative polysaccharide biosynthesis protein
VGSGALLNASGHPNITLRFRLVTTVVHVIGFLIAVIYFKDVVAVAAAFVIGSYLLLPLNLYLQHKYAGIAVFDHLWQLRWIAVCTALMAVAVFSVKAVLPEHIHPAVQLAAEVVVGGLAYLVAAIVFERSLVREVVTFALQAVPGGDRIARVLHIPVRKRGKRRRQPEAAAIARAESREADLDMDVAADLGADEARTADI